MLYLSDMNNPHAHGPRLKASAVLIWHKLSPEMPFGKHTTLAISFFIRTVPPFAVIDLASFLLYIVGAFGCHATDTGLDLFTHIGYAIRPDGVSGLLLCTRTINYAYQNVLTDALQNPALHAINGWPMSTWPPNVRSIRHKYSAHISLNVAK